MPAAKPADRAVADCDVVVIGGGIQGLVALNALLEKGYSCALVTEGDLGGGQTLHSHGFLNSGFGFAGPELPKASADVVQPELLRRGLELGREWVLIPPPGFPVQEGAPPATLPRGFDPSQAEGAIGLPDASFPKRPLVEALSDGNRDRVLRGHATPSWDGERVEAVTVRQADTGEEVTISTRALVVAAGCGSKRILEKLVGRTPQVERIQHRRVQMVCLRAPRGALPTTSVAAMPLGLLLAAHDQPDGVTWYVTPWDFGGPTYGDVPTDAAADVDPELVVRACQGLLQLFPGLALVDGLQVGCYAGYRQDIGNLPATPMCELVDGTANVVAALPSGLVGPWLNAVTMIEILGPLVDPSHSQGPLPGAGVGVHVGQVVEDRPGFAWMSWDEWLRAHPGIEGGG
ncbi:MAG: hypothetical protein QOE92_1408 [Chloroflexota bacterium]|nr:hypothetical protein [Chloroflexota bacterium]